jgi:16S rRNA (uracil1498-N3)-methyltransferase
MSMRAFTPDGAEPPRPGAMLELDEEESRYLVKVRRARIGDALELFDGHGSAWAATLRTIGRRVQIEVGVALRSSEAATRVLLLGLPDQVATLEALTSASELGATQVILVACERSQGRVPSAARLHRVLRAAQRQCGRLRALELVGGPPDAPLPLDRALAIRDELPGLFAWEALRDAHAETNLVDETGLRLLVGPEGGLTAQEVEQIRAAGFRAVGLGPWVLRTPTAVIAMLARFHGF